MTVSILILILGLTATASGGFLMRLGYLGLMAKLRDPATEKSATTSGQEISRQRLLYFIRQNLNKTVTLEQGVVRNAMQLVAAQQINAFAGNIMISNWSKEFLLEASQSFDEEATKSKTIAELQSFVIERNSIYVKGLQFIADSVTQTPRFSRELVNYDEWIKQHNDMLLAWNRLLLDPNYLDLKVAIGENGDVWGRVVGH